MLVLNNVEVTYSDVILALKGVTMSVREGQCVALLGGNGAGKSTTLKAVSGTLKSEDGAVTGGSITLSGEQIQNMEPSEIVKRGLLHVMEGRRVLRHNDGRVASASRTIFSTCALRSPASGRRGPRTRSLVPIASTSASLMFWTR